METRWFLRHNKTLSKHGDRREFIGRCLRCDSGEAEMPTICMFYGIIISMFFEINDRHHLPHIHVRYQGTKASIAIEDGSLLAGEIPARQLRMVQVWIDLHQDELLADWELAKAGEEPFRIDPLK